MLLYESGGDDPGETDNLGIVAAAGQADSGIRLSYCFFPGAVLNLIYGQHLSYRSRFYRLESPTKVLFHSYTRESGSFVNRLYSVQNKESIPGFLPGFKLMNRIEYAVQFLRRTAFSIQLRPFHYGMLETAGGGQMKRPALFKPWSPMAVDTATLDSVESNRHSLLCPRHRRQPWGTTP